MPATRRALCLTAVLAALLCWTPGAWAQDGAAPAASALENQFDQQRDQMAPAADTPAAAPAASGDDALITNLDSKQDNAAPIVNDGTAQPPDMPAAIAAPSLPTPSAPAAPAAAGDTAATMPAAITPPAAATPSAPAAAAATGTAAAPAKDDPLAAFRAQQQIKDAEQRAASKNAPNPLGPAGQLPLTAPNGAISTQQTPEELQAQLEAEAAEQEKKVKKQIFDTSLESLLPLTPEQTRDVLHSFKESREAAETPIAVPEAKTTVENVSLDPSVAPLTIHTSPGYVTTVTILDMTGAPWAIQDVSWAGKFDVTTPEEGGHVIRITPQSAHGVGNISIRLVDLITPITFSIATGLETVDYRFDARIPKPGPLAKTPLMEYGGLKSVAGGDENLMRVLDGTAVSNAQKLTLDGPDGATSAYRIDDIIYLRTPLTLLSPAWQTSATSADGMNVYTLKASPVILLSDHGRMVKAKIKNTED